MCIILFSYGTHPRFRCIVAANRDEFYLRPTAQASFWQDHPHVLAGRDLEQMGTWMGVTKQGRFAALTNYRTPSAKSTNAKSRGELVGSFLCGQVAPIEYLQEVKEKSELYQGFNLLAGDLEGWFYLSSESKRIEPITPGIYGLSNAKLNTPWPKVERGKKGLQACLDKEIWDQEELFRLLADVEQPQDHELPDTGVGLEWERTLSSIWIRSPKYGTRSSTVMTVDYDQNLMFTERTYFPDEEKYSELSFSFRME